MRYPTYPKYRKASIKWAPSIPSEWDDTMVKFCFDIQLGKMLQPKPTNIDDVEFPYLKALHVNWDNVDSENLPKMFVSKKDIEKYSITEGDLLVCEGGEVGRAAIIKKLIEPAIIQNALHRVRSDELGDVSFFSYMLRNISDAGWFDILCNKATIAHLTGEKLGAIRIPVPPVKEQQTISKFLDLKSQQIDMLIEKKMGLIEKLEEKRIAVITQAVTKGIDEGAKLKPSGVEWLGDVPEHWNIIRTKFNVSHIGSGKTPSGGSEVYVEDGIMMLRSQNIYDDGLRLSNVVRITEEADSLQLSSRINDHDVLLNITGASIGRASIVPLGFPISNVNQHVCIVRPEQEKIDPRYLHLQLCSHVAKHQIMMNQVGTSREGLTFPQVGDLTFSLPSLVEQQEILEFCEKETIKNKLMKQKIELAISKLKEYRSAIITSAVTGEIDVREIDLAGI
ncbi:restriction endonuclease subunit S [Vibrio sp. PNB22_2_2]